jgi:long-chain acyl-CoA synthetase
MMFRVGGTLILERSFTYPAAILGRIVRERVTGFPMIPTISAMLLQMDLSKWDFSHLRYLTNAGAAMPLDHIAKIRKLMPHVKIYSMYGQTECTRVTYLPPDQIDIRPGSVGRGMPNQEHYIVDAAGNRVGPGVVGELVVRGSHVMKGYWEMPAETEKALRPGLFPWEKVLHTGDLFKTDAEGYLYFVGRKDDIIKTRGEKVSPREVEDVLFALPGVAQAAVIGVPDKMLGSAIKAVIVPRPGVRLTEQEVLAHCASRLDDYMVPKFVEFRDEMPTTASGKVAKLILSEQARESI